MNFLLALLALIIEFSWGDVGSARTRQWSVAWAAWLATHCAQQPWYRGWPGALMLLGLPVLAVGLFLQILMSWSHALYYLASLALLLWMLGPTDLNREIEEYRRSLDLSGDERVAATPAFTSTTAGIDFGLPTNDLEFDACRAELAALAVAAERAWFAPLFWFFVLGPCGAVVYRLAVSLERAALLEASIGGAMTWIHEALAWIPARITAINLGIAGTLLPVLEGARTAGVFRWGASTELVAKSALAATDYGRVQDGSGDDPHIQRLNQMRALVRRALNVWMVLLAIVTVV